MQPTLVITPKNKLAESVKKYIVDLPNGHKVPVHVATYKRSDIRPRLIVFDKATLLLKWCKKMGISDAISGGFSLHHQDKLLGEIWTGGQKHDSVPFMAPWHARRGSAHITPTGHIKIAPRHHLPLEPDGDLLQAGPLLVHRGISMIKDGHDPDGTSAISHLLDDDWTTGHWPRTAIGASDEFIFCLATDGYGPKTNDGEYGLSLSELADIMIELGATEALNLDGGSSTTLVVDGKLVNKARAGQKNNYEVYPEGRPIPTAIIFERTN